MPQKDFLNKEGLQYFYNGLKQMNVASADRLSTPRMINGTNFNGSANITTANWGTARNIGIVNSDGTGTAVTTPVNGSSNINLKLPSTIKANIDGNANSASKLQTARTINGVSFDGSANIVIPVPTKVSELQNDSGYLTTIPTASSTVLGGIKVGNGLSISNGVLNVDIDEIIADKILEDNKKKYPVGKIIMSTTNTNPSTYLGFGTWQLWGSGRVPVGVDTAQTEFNTPEKTGGEKECTLNVTQIPTHSHIVQGETSYDGTHEHRLPSNLQDKEQPGNIDYFTGYGYGFGSYYPFTMPGNGAHSHTLNFVSQNTGGGMGHNNLQPYITCYMWKRTA